MYSFDSKIRYTECDLDGFLTIESLIDYFQDCSTFQTQEGPATMESMAQLGIAWVINSWQVVVNRLPKLGERVVIGTIPYELRGFLGLRNFIMRTEEGEELAVANSIWSLINLEKGVPYRINDDIIKTYPLEDKLPMEYAPRKISDQKDAGEYEAAEKKVGMHHLDTNNHVNNGQYIRIALQAFEQIGRDNGLDSLMELARERKQIQIRADYRQQAHLGDVICPKVYISTDENGETVCSAFLNDEKGAAYAAVEVKRTRHK